jgi:hypothetical protein
MKKLFVILGVVFFCIVITGVIGFCIAAYYGTKLDKSSKEYVDEVTPIIISSWNSNELMSRASPELLKVAPQDKVEAMFQMFAEKLGSLREYKGSKGGSFMNITPAGKVVTASYIVEASFPYGDAEIKVRVIQHHGKWQILEFFVNSESFMP